MKIIIFLIVTFTLLSCGSKNPCDSFVGNWSTKETPGMPFVSILKVSKNGPNYIIESVIEATGPLTPSDPVRWKRFAICDNNIFKFENGSPIHYFVKEGYILLENTEYYKK